MALRWEDIDFNGRFITVKNNRYRGRISTPKTDSSIGSVDKSAQLTEVLMAHYTASKKKGLRLGIDEPEFVFTDSDGRPIKRFEWRNKVLNRALKKAGLRKIKVKDLRHTYATLRIAAAHNIVNVAKQLGHASVKTTLDVYAVFVPDLEQK